MKQPLLTAILAGMLGWLSVAVLDSPAQTTTNNKQGEQLALLIGVLRFLALVGKSDRNANPTR
jgi:hypothetical protein